MNTDEKIPPSLPGSPPVTTLVSGILIGGGKTSPIRAPILSSIHTYYMEKPVKLPVSVPVENTPNNRSVYQNTADLHLAKSPPKALESR
jgi:hypothetical protein